MREKKRVSLIQETIIGKKLLVTATPVLNDKGDVSMIVMNSRDVTEIEKLRKELNELSNLAQKYKTEAEEFRKRELDTSNFIISSKQMGDVFKVAERVAAVAVSYTHLDVYKRQLPYSTRGYPCIEANGDEGCFP